MSSIELTENEIVSMTGCKRPKDQLDWFRNAGIPAYKKRGDKTGELCVLRVWAEQAPLQRSPNASKAKPKFENLPQ